MSSDRRIFVVGRLKGLRLPKKKRHTQGWRQASRSGPDPDLIGEQDFPTSCAYQTPTNTDSQPAHLLMSTSLTSVLIVKTTYPSSHAPLPAQLTINTSRSHGGKPRFGCFKLLNQLGQHRIFRMQMSHRRKCLHTNPFSQNSIIV